ncbi:MAG: transcriptional regulator [Propionibacteriales bacterium]|nr:transcriptional regulator [Propionibacteriales bacterium]
MDTVAASCPTSIYDVGCEGRMVLDRIGDRWTVLIIGSLAGGTQRFSELRDTIGDITPKVLTQTLRALERDGFVTRKVYAEVPPRVEYTLTELGRSLLPPISMIRAWAEQYGPHVLALRERHDQGRESKVGS